VRIIDGQQHEPSVWLNWNDTGDEAVRDQLLVELELAAMNAVGISGVVLHPSHRRWAEMAATTMPDRFAIVANYPQATIEKAGDIAAVVAAERKNPTVVGLRIVLNSRSPRWQTPTQDAIPLEAKASHDLTQGIAFFEAGGYDMFLSACEREGMPVFVFAPTRVDVIGRMAERHPTLTMVVDHLGLSQPPVADPDDPPFTHIKDLVRLAQYPRVSVKLCGVPALSSEEYPYRDVWKELMKVLDAFGVERVMWASDISRITGRAGFDSRNPYGESDYPGKHNLSEALRYVLDSSELTPLQKEWILGRTASTLLNWNAGRGTND
jgi:L-fuconolactonase